ncbi:glycosyltransferase family 2 protein [Salinimicrobium gaetbulicola]|uniref:Glycosyltransferase family 2 protein n=1 Tax=Salinimicrobium gaetbulicola TaxID=999702 RepID=A0ABW3IJ11_9FLAO
MRFSLIICTFQRPKALVKLLDSVSEQTEYPDEILIIDGSDDNQTKDILVEKKFRNTRYFKVLEGQRGLTRQRNFGIQEVSEETEIICFLDDDVVLKMDYFENLFKTYIKYPEAIGVGGYIIDDIKWEENGEAEFGDFVYDGFKRKLGSRNVLRKKFGLLSETPPGVMPKASNGFSTGFLPPSGKVYPVEYFMGGVASYRKELFQKIRFSHYFEGYGLYEDMDFCLRASKLGQLYVNTTAQLFHYHEEAGRPNRYEYGKMVIRNGWYVWRVKNPSPDLEAKLKWHATVFLLTFVRMGNIFTTSKRKEALTESLGRVVGWWSLIFKKPL